ncbi:MAG: FAD-binding oxidoreductase [Alphaproteobacteria bacterium]|nr:FAD-binding oxidoreductase [Alphaproteobacteria bacterium]
MTAWTEQTLTTWGRSRYARTATAAPAGEAALHDAVTERAESGLVAYGGGRCYGDAALGDGGRTILTSSLNQILSFDRDTREVVCEAGVDFTALLERFVPDGFCFPVSAATASVTVGGAVANDIHSKNHHAVGSFGDHVTWIDLMLASGEVVRASRDRNTEIFRATLGGIGLTGVILRVGFRLMPIPSGAADVRYRRMRDVDEMIDTIEGARGGTAYLFAWVDAMARGGALGRGILELGDHATSDSGAVPPPPVRPIRFVPPSFLLRPSLLRWYTNRRFNSLPPGGRDVRMGLAPFFFPLDSMPGFNRVYGPRGFYSIHTGFPRQSQRAGIRAVMEAVTTANAGSFAAVMKPMRGPGDGYLSFPMEGMAYAVDLPRRRGIEELHAVVERIVLDHGGRLYVAKDALMTADAFARMFPRLERFRKVLAEVDPDRRFQSDMSRRLAIHG